MTKSRGFIFILLLLASFSHPAHALCLGVGIVSVPAVTTFSSLAGEYGVFDPAEYMQSVQVQIGGGASILTCSYFVTVSPGSSGNAAARQLTRGGDTLDYNIYADAGKSNILMELPAAGAGNVIAGSFPVILGLGQVNTHSFYWTIDPLQVEQAGAQRFEDSVVVKLYTGNLISFSKVAEATVTLRARAESSVDLSLVDTAAGFSIGDTAQTVDFGVLVSGATRSFDTVIRSNDGYRVTMQSQNGQVLKHQSPAVTTYVPYSLQLDGANVDLTGGAAVEAAQAGGVTAASGQPLETSFTIGGLDGSEAAGTYQDVVTVTVSAQ